jgi:tetratricopeptide (TPR) repeat protein
VWQALRAELHPRGLEVVTVALDIDVDRAREYIQKARPEHPSLIDQTHIVDELFGVYHVPNSIWIDEEGTIVRPAEIANVGPSFMEKLERGDVTLPEDMAPSWREALEEAKKIRFESAAYEAALRDWVENGTASEWVRSPDEVIERSERRSRERAEAAAWFELGTAFHERGEIEAAQEAWRRAHRLYPENWTYKRQAWELVFPGEQGRTAIYEGSWLDDVRAIGVENYSPPLRK